MMKYPFIAVVGTALCCHSATAQTADTTRTNQPVALTIDAGKVVAKVSPTLYGIMTEEINHSYDGGLYAELIRNRIFKDDATKPVYWSASPDKMDSALIKLDTTQWINDTLTVCLQLSAANATASHPVGITNEGY